MRVQNIPNRKHIQKLLQIPGKAGVESQPNQQVNGYRINLACQISWLNHLACSHRTPDPRLSTASPAPSCELLPLRPGKGRRGIRTHRDNQFLISQTVLAMFPNLRPH